MAGSKCNHMYPYNRETEGGLHTHRREGDAEMEQRDLKMLALKTGVIQSQAKECWHPLEAGGSKD